MMCLVKPSRIAEHLIVELLESPSLSLEDEKDLVGNLRVIRMLFNGIERVSMSSVPFVVEYPLCGQTSA